MDKKARLKEWIDKKTLGLIIYTYPIYVLGGFFLYLDRWSFFSLTPPPPGPSPGYQMVCPYA